LEEDGECDEKGVPKNFVHLCLGDMKFTGTMALLGPLAKAVAAYGRWTGEEERLLKKYWY
jgi:hypothetical protein